MMIDPQAYLAAPCRASSIPYWKSKQVVIPDGMLILHHDDWLRTDTSACTDEPYFRLIHDLSSIDTPKLPSGYTLCAADMAAYAGHISQCSPGLRMTAAELEAYQRRAVYCADLWIAVRHDATGQIVASGIAELDREIVEGALEWIQVSSAHRGAGLGTFIVQELLRRLRDRADFVTVSGRCDHPDRPERLYRKCGFSGSDIWHILHTVSKP